MRIGKLTNQSLKEIVLSKLRPSEDVLIGSAVGEDCAAIQFGSEACVLSTDPITGASENIGSLAVHVSGNDVASSGARPAWMLATMLVPPDKTQADVEKVADELIRTADKLGIAIVGGHTEVTDAVTRIVVSTTVIGRTPVAALVSSGGAKPGDSLIMTKYAAMEGTYIIAAEQKEKLSGVLSVQDFKEASVLGEKISVISEGMIGGQNGASAMHDVTEGGIYGAVHELCEASGVGCDLYKENIPVLNVTRRICTHLDISPYRLIGSGSMLITTDNSQRMMDELSDAGIMATQIGEITGSDVCIIENGRRTILAPPDADALFGI